MEQTTPLDGHRLTTPSWTGELRGTLLLAAPLALANMLQMLTYAVDVIFIARLGEAELAASSLVMAIFGLIVWSLNSLTGAVAPLIAADLGANPRAIRPVRRAVRMALWLAVISGAFGMALALVTIPVMHATGQPPQVIALAVPYVLAVVWSLIPMVIGNVLRTYVSTLGRPIFATIITALGIGVNAAGNYVLIFGNFGAPRLELIGAGIATIVTTTVTMLAYVAIIQLDPKLSRYRIFGRLWRPDWERFKQILRIGTPIALTVIAEAGIFGAAAFLMGRFGASELAGHTVALNIAAWAGGDDPGWVLLRRARSTRHFASRLGGDCNWHWLHGGYRKRNGLCADDVAVRLCRSLRGQERGVGGLCAAIPVVGRRVPIGGWFASGFAGRAARPSGHARADVDRGVQLLGAGIWARRRAWLFHAVGRDRGLDWPCDRPSFCSDPSYMLVPARGVGADDPLGPSQRLTQRLTARKNRQKKLRSIA